jgi:uncharacterized protein YehS (DUF1456 family)
MIHNDVLRSVRYILNVGDEALAAIGQLGGAQTTAAEVSAFLRHEHESGYQACSDAVMASFLDGLIVHRRPKGPAAPRPAGTPVTNNTVLKKLRVAFELRDDDLVAIMKRAGFAVSKPELSALFRDPSHGNYRACGDQFLRNFLRSLAAHLRGAPP